MTSISMTISTTTVMTMSVLIVMFILPEVSIGDVSVKPYLYYTCVVVASRLDDVIKHGIIHTTLRSMISTPLGCHTSL